MLRNLVNLFGVSNIPLDSGLPKHPNEMDIHNLRGVFKRLFAKLQRGKVLEAYKYIDECLQWTVRDFFIPYGSLRELL